MQLQQFRLLGWIRHLQRHLESNVVPFEVMNDGPQIRAGEVMARCHQQEFQPLATLGIVLPHGSGFTKTEAYLMGF